MAFITQTVYAKSESLNLIETLEDEGITLLNPDYKESEKQITIYLFRGEGCEHCFKGYKNRIAIAEVLVITDEIRSAITNSASKDKMRKLVYLDGETHTLLEDGLEKESAAHGEKYDDQSRQVQRIVKDTRQIHPAQIQSCILPQDSSQQLGEPHKAAGIKMKRTMLIMIEKVILPLFLSIGSVNPKNR